MKGQFFPYKDKNVSKHFPYVTYSLIALNVIVFILSLSGFEQVIETYGFTPAHFLLLTLFTSLFLHGGIDHLFGNMLYLYLFGDNVVDTFGRVIYLLFYLAAGIVAALAQFATDPTSTIPTIGASGAISGVLGAYIILFPKVKVRVASYFWSGRVSALYLIGFWFVLQLVWGAFSFLGDQGSGIAFFAHVGGFVFGAAVTYIYRQLR
jgi:membrane associated rhomboid family serine protease